MSIKYVFFIYIVHFKKACIIVNVFLLFYYYYFTAGKITPLKNYYEAETELNFFYLDNSSEQNNLIKQSI